jgi:hypothetical protein
MVQPKVKVRISKTRIDAALKDPDMLKAKGKAIEIDIRKKDSIKKM